jgi:hypothetical protein
MMLELRAAMTERNQQDKRSLQYVALAGPANRKTASRRSL